MAENEEESQAKILIYKTVLSSCGSGESTSENHFFDALNGTDKTLSLNSIIDRLTLDAQ